MQPTNKPRPVMDVTAPPRPAPPASRPAVSLPVREAPARRPEEPDTNPPPTPPEAPQATAPEPEPTGSNSLFDAATAEFDAAPSKSTSNKTPAPVGAIVGAIFGMMILAGVAVLIYLNS